MFSTQQQLDQRTGPYGIGRFSYLQSLVTEFQDTSILEYKQQVLANLANFAYDPINYQHFETLNIVDLFLDTLEEDDEALVQFAIGGICNCCLDKRFKEKIVKDDGIKLVIKCLSSTNEETVLSAVTSLMYLICPSSKQEITSLPVIECMLRFSRSENPRLRNLADLFIQDYCNPHQIEEAKRLQQEMSQSHIEISDGHGSVG